MTIKMFKQYFRLENWIPYPRKPMFRHQKLCSKSYISKVMDIFRFWWRPSWIFANLLYFQALFCLDMFFRTLIYIFWHIHLQIVNLPNNCFYLSDILAAILDFSLQRSQPAFPRGVPRLILFGIFNLSKNNLQTLVSGFWSRILWQGPLLDAM